MGKRPLFSGVHNNVGPVVEGPDSVQSIKKYISESTGIGLDKLSDDMVVLSKTNPIDYNRKRIETVNRITLITADATHNIVEAMFGSGYRRTGINFIINVNERDQITRCDDYTKADIKRKLGKLLIDFVLEQVDPLTEQAREEFLRKYPE